MNPSIEVNESKYNSQYEPPRRPSGGSLEVSDNESDTGAQETQERKKNIELLEKKQEQEKEQTILSILQEIITEDERKARRAMGRLLVEFAKVKKSLKDFSLEEYETKWMFPIQALIACHQLDAAKLLERINRVSGKPGSDSEIMLKLTFQALQSEHPMVRILRDLQELAESPNFCETMDCPRERDLLRRLQNEFIIFSGEDEPDPDQWIASLQPFIELEFSHNKESFREALNKLSALDKRISPPEGSQEARATINAIICANGQAREPSDPNGPLRGQLELCRALQTISTQNPQICQLGSTLGGTEDTLISFLQRLEQDFKLPQDEHQGIRTFKSILSDPNSQLDLEKLMYGVHALYRLSSRSKTKSGVIIPLSSPANTFTRTLGAAIEQLYLEKVAQDMLSFVREFKELADSESFCNSSTLEKEFAFLFRWESYFPYNPWDSSVPHLPDNLSLATQAAQFNSVFPFKDFDSASLNVSVLTEGPVAKSINSILGDVRSYALKVELLCEKINGIRKGGSANDREYPVLSGCTLSCALTQFSIALEVLSKVSQEDELPHEPQVPKLAEAKEEEESLSREEKKSVAREEKIVYVKSLMYFDEFKVAIGKEVEKIRRRAVTPSYEERQKLLIIQAVLDCIFDNKICRVKYLLEASILIDQLNTHLGSPVESVGPNMPKEPPRPNIRSLIGVTTPFPLDHSLLALSPGFVEFQKTLNRVIQPYLQKYSELHGSALHLNLESGGKINVLSPLARQIHASVGRGLHDLAVHPYAPKPAEGKEIKTEYQKAHHLIEELIVDDFKSCLDAQEFLAQLKAWQDRAIELQNVGNYHAAAQIILLIAHKDVIVQKKRTVLKDCPKKVRQEITGIIDNLIKRHNFLKKASLQRLEEARGRVILEGLHKNITANVEIQTLGDLLARVNQELSKVSQMYSIRYGAHRNLRSDNENIAYTFFHYRNAFLNPTTLVLIENRWSEEAVDKVKNLEHLLPIDHNEEKHSRTLRTPVRVSEEDTNEQWIKWDQELRKLEGDWFSYRSWIQRFQTPSKKPINVAQGPRLLIPILSNYQGAMTRFEAKGMHGPYQEDLSFLKDQFPVGIPADGCRPKIYSVLYGYTNKQKALLESLQVSLLNLIESDTVGSNVIHLLVAVTWFQELEVDKRNKYLTLIPRKLSQLIEELELTGTLGEQLETLKSLDYFENSDPSNRELSTLRDEMESQFKSECILSASFEVSNGSETDEKALPLKLNRSPSQNNTSTFELPPEVHLPDSVMVIEQRRGSASRSPSPPVSVESVVEQKGHPHTPPDISPKISPAVELDHHWHSGMHSYVEKFRAVFPKGHCPYTDTLLSALYRKINSKLLQAEEQLENRQLIDEDYEALFVDLQKKCSSLIQRVSESFLSLGKEDDDEKVRILLPEHKKLETDFYSALDQLKAQCLGIGLPEIQLAPVFFRSDPDTLVKKILKKYEKKQCVVEDLLLDFLHMPGTRDSTSLQQKIESFCDNRFIKGPRKGCKLIKLLAENSEKQSIDDYRTLYLRKENGKLMLYWRVNEDEIKSSEVSQSRISAIESMLTSGEINSSAPNFNRILSFCGLDQRRNWLNSYEYDLQLKRNKFREAQIAHIMRQLPKIVPPLQANSSKSENRDEQEFSRSSRIADRTEEEREEKEDSKWGLNSRRNSLSDLVKPEYISSFIPAGSTGETRPVRQESDDQDRKRKDSTESHEESEEEDEDPQAQKTETSLLITRTFIDEDKVTTEELSDQKLETGIFCDETFFGSPKKETDLKGLPLTGSASALSLNHLNYSQSKKAQVALFYDLVEFIGKKCREMEIIQGETLFQKEGLARRVILQQARECAKQGKTFDLIVLIDSYFAELQSTLRNSHFLNVDERLRHLGSLLNEVNNRMAVALPNPRLVTSLSFLDRVTDQARKGEWSLGKYVAKIMDKVLLLGDPLSAPLVACLVDHFENLKKQPLTTHEKAFSFLQICQTEILAAIHSQEEKKVIPDEVDPRFQRLKAEETYSWINKRMVAVYGQFLDYTRDNEFVHLARLPSEKIESFRQQFQIEKFIRLNKMGDVCVEREFKGLNIKQLSEAKGTSKKRYLRKIEETLKASHHKVVSLVAPPQKSLDEMGRQKLLVDYLAAVGELLEKALASADEKSKSNPKKKSKNDPKIMPPPSADQVAVGAFARHIKANCFAPYGFVFPSKRELEKLKEEQQLAGIDLYLTAQWDGCQGGMARDRLKSLWFGYSLSDQREQIKKIQRDIDEQSKSFKEMKTDGAPSSVLKLRQKLQALSDNFIIALSTKDPDLDYHSKPQLSPARDVFEVKFRESYFQELFQRMEESRHESSSFWADKEEVTANICRPEEDKKHFSHLSTSPTLSVFMSLVVGQGTMLREVNERLKEPCSVGTKDSTRAGNIAHVTPVFPDDKVHTLSEVYRSYQEELGLTAPEHQEFLFKFLHQQDRSKVDPKIGGGAGFPAVLANITTHLTRALGKDFSLEPRNSGEICLGRKGRRMGEVVISTRKPIPLFNYYRGTEPLAAITFDILIDFNHQPPSFRPLNVSLFFPENKSSKNSYPALIRKALGGQKSERTIILNHRSVPSLEEIKDFYGSRACLESLRTSLHQQIEYKRTKVVEKDQAIEFLEIGYLAKMDEFLEIPFIVEKLLKEKELELRYLKKAYAPELLKEKKQEFKEKTPETDDDSTMEFSFLEFKKENAIGLLANLEKEIAILKMNFSENTLFQKKIREMERRRVQFKELKDRTEGVKKLAKNSLKAERVGDKLLMDSRLEIPQLEQDIKRKQESLLGLNKQLAEKEKRQKKLEERYRFLESYLGRNRASLDFLENRTDASLQTPVRHVSEESQMLPLSRTPRAAFQINISKSTASLEKRNGTVESNSFSPSAPLPPPSLHQPVKSKDDLELLRHSTGWSPGLFPARPGSPVTSVSPLAFHDREHKAHHNRRFSSAFPFSGSYSSNIKTGSVPSSGDTTLKSEILVKVN